VRLETSGSSAQRRVALRTAPRLDELSGSAIGLEHEQDVGPWNLPGSLARERPPCASFPADSKGPGHTGASAAVSLAPRPRPAEGPPETLPHALMLCSPSAPRHPARVGCVWPSLLLSGGMPARLRRTASSTRIRPGGSNRPGGSAPERWLERHLRFRGRPEGPGGRLRARAVHAFGQEPRTPLHRPDARSAPAAPRRCLRRRHAVGGGPTKTGRALDWP
jgi:hypothetical protein